MTKSSGYTILSGGKISRTRSTVPTVMWTYYMHVMFYVIEHCAVCPCSDKVAAPHLPFLHGILWKEKSRYSN
jgi:hypothetical protein